MKNIISSLLLSLLSVSGFCQDLRYEVHGRYSRPIKESQLKDVRFLRDIIPGYPTNWITNYGSVEISATCNGKAVNAVSPDDTLSPEQKNIFHTVDLASDLVIHVKYTYHNPATDAIENNQIHVSMTVVPEIEAEYVGGYEQMMQFIKENGMCGIPETNPKKFQRAMIRFTVNEEGEITHARVSNTSTDPEIDKLLLEVINKMPKWKPAENSKGVKVKQEFELSAGNIGGC